MMYVQFFGAGGGGPDPTRLVFYFAEVLPDPPDTLQAPPTTERATFLARLTVSGSEGFESTSSFDPMDSHAFSTNGVTATISTPFPGALFVDTAFDGLFNTTPGGVMYGQMGFDDGFGGLAPVVFTFSTPIAAFGCYFTDIGDFGGNLTITLNKTGGGTVVYPVPNISGTSGWLAFWGFVDNTSQTYDSIEMISDDTAEAIAIDDVVMATFAQIA